VVVYIHIYICAQIYICAHICTDDVTTSLLAQSITSTHPQRLPPENMYICTYVYIYTAGVCSYKCVYTHTYKHICVRIMSPAASRRTTSACRRFSAAFFCRCSSTSCSLCRRRTCFVNVLHGVLSVLQCVVSALQCIAVYCFVLSVWCPCVAVWCSVL